MHKAIAFKKKSVYSIAITILFFLFITACSTTKKAVVDEDFERDGYSMESAIILTVKNESESTKAEFDYLTQHFSGFKQKKQSNESKNGKNYIVTEVESKDGQTKKLYFLIEVLKKNK